MPASRRGRPRQDLCRCPPGPGLGHGGGTGLGLGLLAGLALLVEGEDLQLDGEVDLAHVDAVRDGQDGRREVEWR